MLYIYNNYFNLYLSPEPSSFTEVDNYYNIGFRFENSQNNIDTEKLNIQYVSGSSYTFDQFVHFGSAAERLKNFYYKINILYKHNNIFYIKN